MSDRTGREFDKGLLVGAGAVAFGFYIAAENYQRENLHDAIGSLFLWGLAAVLVFGGGAVLYKAARAGYRRAAHAGNRVSSAFEQMEDAMAGRALAVRFAFRLSTIVAAALAISAGVVALIVALDLIF